MRSTNKSVTKNSAIPHSDIYKRNTLVLFRNKVKLRCTESGTPNLAVIFPQLITKFIS